MNAARMSDAAAARDEDTFRRAAPPELISRYLEIENAAIAIAFASKPHGETLAAVEYWRTLGPSAQSAHRLRAVHAVADALHIAHR
jgi:hypothetical protein